MPAGRTRFRRRLIRSIGHLGNFAGNLRALSAPDFHRRNRRRSRRTPGPAALYRGPGASCHAKRRAIKRGLCLYPIVNHPGWDDDRHCTNGLWDYADEAGHREIFAPLAEELKHQQQLFAAPLDATERTPFGEETAPLRELQDAARKMKKLSEFGRKTAPLICEDFCRAGACLPPTNLRLREVAKIAKSAGGKPPPYKCGVVTIFQSPPFAFALPRFWRYRISAVDQKYKSRFAPERCRLAACSNSRTYAGFAARLRTNL